MRMLRIALKSLRERWVSLVGAFVALALGVAMMLVMLLGLAAAPALPGGEAVVSLVAALGTAGGVSAFVSAFVVASTFSYLVAQRRRELGLLRLAGAGRAQVRRVVLVEALALGAAASAAGCALGRIGASSAARWLVGVGMAPPEFAIGGQTWPTYAAFGAGLLVALGGVAVAAWRAGRVGPLEALSSADVDTRVMTAGRWCWGLGLLSTAAALTGSALASDPADLLHRKTYTVLPMVLICACGLLAPVLARPLLRVLAWAPARWSRFTGRLVRAGATAALRRTGAVAAPVLVAVALTGSLAGALSTVGAARSSEAGARSAADVVVLPRDAQNTPAAQDALTRALRAVPGVVVAPSAPTALSVAEPDGTVVRARARTADPAVLAAVTRLPVLAGSPSFLDDDGIVLPAEWGRTTVGDPVQVVRADGSRATLRVAAVLRDGFTEDGLYVTARNAPGARIDRLDVRLTGPTGGGTATDRDRTADRLRSAAQPFGAEVVTRDEWLAATAPANGRIAWLRIVLVLGLALVYTGIALANTLVMATRDRRRELALLRLAGATRSQVVRVVTVESLLVVVVGAVLGCAVAAVQLGTMHTALTMLGVNAPPTVPWREVGLVTLVCLVVAAPSAAVTALWALRHRPVTAVAR
ncbi:FtsX-like permease family protein [Kitasatospora sp. NPDC087314]|uniref:FtsX-like permease family protein n=1 Tax=Kitasatospora sp. NPDC087314 TaxID=3364068 RepID=UPI00382F18E1